MRVAVLGAGTMGSTYVRNLAKMKDVQPAGVCDIRSEAAGQAAELWGTNAYESLEAMVEREQPDVVCVCLPTYMHKEYVLKLAAMGKHVICEKPIALNREDAEAMIRACREAGVQLYIGHVLRFFPNYKDLHAKAKSGIVGTVQVAHAKRLSAFPKGWNRWFADASLSGGVILDLMIHDLDFLRWTMGDVQSVYAKLHKDENMEYANVTLQFRSGALANVEAFWGYPGAFTTGVELAGTRGVLRFDSSSSPTLEVRRIRREEGGREGSGVPVPRTPAKHDPYYYELRHFLSCIAGESEPVITAEDGYAALDIALAAAQSASTGLPVRMGGVLA